MTEACSTGPLQWLAKHPEMASSQLNMYATMYQPPKTWQNRFAVITLQNKTQLCCTLYQWFLHIVAVVGLCICMPTNKCSKGGKLLAIGQLTDSSQNHHHTHPMHILTSKLCLPLYSFVYLTRNLLFYKSHRCLGTCLKTGGSQTLPPGPIQHTTAQLCYIL